MNVGVDVVVARAEALGGRGDVGTGGWAEGGTDERTPDDRTDDAPAVPWTRPATPTMSPVMRSRLPVKTVAEALRQFGGSHGAHRRPL